MRNALESGDWIGTGMLFAALMALAAALRFPLLDSRPMHADEAVHADQFGVLLDKGDYRYSPDDLHGPTLCYLTFAAARIEHVAKYVELTEVTLRSVTAVAGVLLVGAHILLVPFLGVAAAGFAALLTAVSPVLVYYSRDYIHETLFVLLTFCLLLAGLQYGRRKRLVWALAAGVSLGLMYATKETTILVAACILSAAVLTIRREAWRAHVSAAHLLAALGAAGLVASVLLTAGFQHPGAIVDSISSYAAYFGRGVSLHSAHAHSPGYYLERLLFYRAPGGPVWSEAFIAILAAFGIGSVLRRRTDCPPVARFLAVFALLMTGAYSLLPYKTPWNALGFWHALILVAGVGAAAVMGMARSRQSRFVAGILLAAGAAHLALEARRNSITFGADPRNPWVYAQTGTDVFFIAERLEQVAAATPAGFSMPVAVISRENLWPLPWYLRRFTGVRWWNAVPPRTPAPVMLATPDIEPEIIRQIYETSPPGHRQMYVRLFDRDLELRPGVKLTGYVAQPLWEQLDAHASAPGVVETP